MKYVDGFVLAVPKENKTAFIQHAQKVADLFKRNGALSVVECWGEDIPAGQLTSFPLAVKCKEDETVCFSWISWPSKDIRDQAMAAILDDPIMDSQNTPVPFDGKRMIFGGFEVLLNV